MFFSALIPVCDLCVNTAVYLQLLDYAVNTEWFGAIIPMWMKTILLYAFIRLNHVLLDLNCLCYFPTAGKCWVLRNRASPRLYEGFWLLFVLKTSPLLSEETTEWERGSQSIQVTSMNMQAQPQTPNTSSACSVLWSIFMFYYIKNLLSKLGSNITLCPLTHDTTYLAFQFDVGLQGCCKACWDMCIW